MAACAAPLVGILAQDWFGFSGDATVTGTRAVDLNNARALGSALLAFTTGAAPWAGWGMGHGAGLWAGEVGGLGRGHAGHAWLPPALALAMPPCPPCPALRRRQHMLTPSMPAPPILTAVPWTFCFFMYTSLHLTYPTDRKRAAERARAAEHHEWQFAREDGPGADEEAVPLRERSLSPPRLRASPTRLHGSSSGALGGRAGDAAQPLRRETPRRGSQDVQ